MLPSRPSEGAGHGQRILNACNACKIGRRRCDGSARCHPCAKRGIVCTYEQNKKRGRKTFDESNGSGAGIRCSAGAETAIDLRMSSVTNPLPVRAVPATQHHKLLLSPTERAVLRTVFDFTNRLMTLGA